MGKHSTVTIQSINVHTLYYFEDNKQTFEVRVFSLVPTICLHLSEEIISGKSVYICILEVLKP